MRNSLPMRAARQKEEMHKAASANLAKCQEGEQGLSTIVNCQLVYPLMGCSI